MMMLSLGRLLVAVTLAVPALGHPRPHALHPLHHPPLSSPFDYSAKIRQREELPFCSLAEAPVSSLLVTRQASEPDDYSCSETRPCRNGACCPKKTGFCQYGPEACGTTGTSPNDVCWNNCDAHAECGKNALPVGKTCPLNVCCSEFGFCGATADFCKVSSDPDKSCQSNCEQPGSGASGGNVQQRVIGYYEAWAHDRTCQNMNFNDIPAGALTHAYFSFAFITPGTFMIAPMDGLDPDLFSDFTAIKKNNAGLKTVVAIGGWSFNDPGPTLTTFSDLVSTAANRQTFIGNLMAFMRKYGFDGVDFDWEYPGAPDRGGRPDDGKNLAIFLEELARVNDQQAERYIVSFTVPTSYWYLRWFDMTAFEHIDFVNVMSYDLHGVWDSSNPIGNHIYGHSNLTEIKLALDLFWRNGVPASKLNLGLGFYGRSFQLSDPTCFRPGCQFRAGASPGPCSQNSGTLTYREIQDIISQYELVPYHDETAAVKYITWNEDQWVSYDDAETFKQKIDFANNLGLGGLLIWAIDQDTDDLEALRGVVGDNNLKLYAKRSDNAAYWEGVSVPDCYVSDCGGSCKSGFLSVTHQPCGGAKPVTRRAKEADSQLCCPLAGTPSASDCTWRGNDPACNGHCQENEVAVQLNKWGDGWYCEGGHKAYCCKTDIQNTCYWTGAGDRCRGDDEALTFAGTFRQRLADLAGLFGGLVGLVLEDALNQANVDMLKLYCCPKQDVGNWQQCQWYGTPGDCSDNHCPIGHSVQLTDSAYGLGEDCGIHLERSRVFCCDAAEGRSPFLPVDLGKLFPSPPSGDQVDTEFELETDDTWGSGSSKTGGADEPEDAAFNFVVLSSPEPLQISLDKRDGSHWELFNCTETDSEEAQTIQMVCTDVSENSNCHKIGLGHGVPGTILQMPKRCGPGKYAVAVDMVKSPHQILPRSVSHLGHKPVIYDLTFDYDFARVPRDLGNTQMRIDYSNQPGYWDKVVSAAASRKRKVKTKTRSLHEDFGGDHIQWLEAEFRDDMHLSSGDALSEDELHKRWFASGIIDWLSNMLSPEISKTFRHVIDNTYVLKVVDAHWTCPLHSGGLLVQAETNVHVETSFGFTLICTLGPPGSFIDLSQSYLTFTNNGEITAIFRLEAFLNLHYDSGEKTLIEIPFPGASFYIPGIATIGPQLNLKARIEASALLSAVMETKVDIASWEFSQTLPPNDEYKPSEPDAVDFGRTGDFSGIQQPTFYAGIQAEGQVRAHAIAEVAFGVSFVDRWNIGRATASVVADGWVEVEARASASTAGNCPFTWGLTAGVDLYAMAEAPQQFKWQLPKYPLPGSGQTTIKPLGECPVPGDGAPARRAVRSVDGLPLPQHDLAVGNGSLDQGHRTLQRRDRIPIGPVWDIPAEKLLCPNSAGAGDTSIACADITGWEDEDVQNALRRRDDDGEWHVLGKRSTQSGRVVMGCARKLQFKAPPYETSGTLGSKFAPKVYGYVRPDVCTDWDFDGDRPLPPSTETEKKWATEHILELQLIPLFFDWLDSKLGATLPEYVPGSTDRTRRLCQVLRTYWYKVPQASRFTMDPGAATRDPVDHVTAVFPSNNEHGDEFVLLDSGVNTAKERMFSDDQNVVREEVITAWLQHSQNRAIKNVKDMMTAMKYLQDTTIAQRLITEKERVGTRLNELDTDKLVNWARKSRAGADFPTWQSLDLETHWNTYMAEKGKAASKKAVLHIDNMLEQIKDAYATASHRKNAQAAADAANPDLSLQLFIDKYDAIVTEWARYKPLAWTNPF